MGGIVYIVSDRRAGSTLLENMLGQQQGIVSVGEMRMLQGHLKKEGPGEKWNWKCSCGEEILECPFWSEVNKTVDLLDKRTRLDHKAFKSGFSQNKKQVVSFIESLSVEGHHIAQDSAKILEEVLDVSDAKWVIDSSKDPFQAYFLYQSRPTKVKLVHLHRSVEALAYSKLKHKGDSSPSSMKMMAYMRQVSRQNQLLKSVVEKIPSKDRYQLNYKDLAQHPKDQLSGLLNFLGVDHQRDNLPTHVEPQISHSIGGTPSRFERRPIEFDDKSAAYFAKHPVLRALAKSWDLE